MLDLILSIVLWCGLLAATLFIAQLYSQGMIAWSWSLLALPVFAIYIFLVKGDVLSLFGVAIPEASAKLNVGGKVLGALFSVVAGILILTRSQLTAENMGLRWRQNQGSVVPAIVLTVLFVVLAAVVDRLIGKNAPVALDSLTWLYPIVAGLDEELLYRGVLLAILCAAVPATAITVFGVRISYGGLVALLLFSIIHGIKVRNGFPMISPPGLILTFVYGGVFLWLRERTGSLLMPVLAHNLGNTIAWLL